MKNIEVKLFGAFRKYVPLGKITMPIDGSCTVQDLKAKIQQQLLMQVPDYREQNLVFESALATDTDILSEDELVDGKASLALLPPVCGG